MARPTKIAFLFGILVGQTFNGRSGAPRDVEQRLQTRYSVLRTQIKGWFSIVDTLLACLVKGIGRLVLIIMLGFLALGLLGVERMAFSQVAGPLMVVSAVLKLDAWLRK